MSSSPFDSVALEAPLAPPSAQVGSEPTLDGGKDSAFPAIEVAARRRHVEVLLFLVCNGAAAGLNFGSRLLLSRLFPYEIAICIAYGCGMLTAFVLARTIVFRATSGAVGRQMFWFVIVNAAAVLQTLGASLLFARLIFPYVGMTWHPETVAHGIGIGVPVVSSYFGHKRLSFAKR